LMEYQKMRVKKFARKHYKHSQDARYWKKFDSVFSQLEEGFMTADISFCRAHDLSEFQPQANQRTNYGLMASATSTRVDIWRLQQREAKKEEGEDDFELDIEPVQTIAKFTETVTAVKMREDGGIILAGDKQGRIELVELKQRLSLRSYPHDHVNQVNGFDFSPNKKAFVSCSNETSWKYFDILKSDGAVFTCQAAHSDNIKQVTFVPGADDLLLSASQDKELKVWSLNHKAIDALTFVKAG